MSNYLLTENILRSGGEEAMSDQSLKPKRQRAGPKKRVLVVNCYFDDTRRTIFRTNKVPQAMGPAYLAGAFSSERCEVLLHNEQYSGPLEDEQLLSWPDMLVLTGLTTSFDRMLHLTAYARTKNPNVIVVAGGPPIRALPRYSRRFFDYCCLGDIEQMNDVIAEAFGEAYVAQENLPRYDQASVQWVGHVESSRNCNFRCSFCSLTGEGGRYQKYDLEYIRKQIIAVGRKKYLTFIDNNFYGNDRKFFLARLELIKEMWKSGHFQGWSALVTNDFFFKDENLELVREAGCQALFSGVESFDTEWLKTINKLQNVRLPQVELIRKCLDAGIVFLYGVMLDFTTRRIDDIRREIEFILGSPDITLPGFLTTVIPILGTPLFHEYLGQGAILPETKIRDLNGNTLALRPLDPLDEVADFIRDLQDLRGYRSRVLRHSLGFFRRYRSKLNLSQMTVALGNAALLCADTLVTASPFSWLNGRSKNSPRTYISTTDCLDDSYQPAFRVASRYEDYFKPTMVTDKNSRLVEELSEDLLAGREPTEVDDENE